MFAPHRKKTTQHILHKVISPSKISEKYKKYKTDTLNEIISAICALLNTGGGNLQLHCLEDTPQNISECVRKIEQRAAEMAGITTMASHVKIRVDHQEIAIEVKESCKLTTVNYNLFLPSESQVIAVPPTTPAAEIKDILQKKIVEDFVVIRSHVKRFIKDKNSGLQGSSDVEIKNLKASPSKCATLAHRIVGMSNKLACYISAFANHRGGHIYYGIGPDGAVAGEVVTEKDKTEITNKVAKTIGKLLWPLDAPERGVQWDIFFEPVKDVNDNPIPFTFVIVLYIASCPGGVFTEQPESYHIVAGEVEKISFKNWCRHFDATPKRLDPLPVLSGVKRISWSSENKKKFFQELTKQLGYYRNNDQMDAFNDLSKLVKQKFKDTDSDLIVIAETTMAVNKRLCFNKARKLLGQLEELLPRSVDSFIFEVRMLLLKSMVERTRGNYQVSYAITQQGLQAMQQIPVDLHTIWYYVEAALITTIISANPNERDIERNRALKNQALQYIELAARDASSLESSSLKRMSELRHKLHIYKAWILLGCSLSAEVVLQPQPSYEDIETAAGELTSVYKSLLEGNIPSHFRNIQYHLAQCDLFRRRSEVSEEDYEANLKQGFDCASRARDLAREHHFENMVSYANKRLADLTEKLVRNARLSRTKENTRRFLNIEY